MADALLWHRLQFAFTATFHYLFPQLTIGLALFIVVLKVTIVILIIALGWGFMKEANHTPYIPPATTATDELGVVHDFGGFGGIVGAAGIVFFAFIGFDAVSTAAQETRNPRRDMPSRKNLVLASSWSRSSVEAVSSSSTFKDAPAILGASVLENRYGRERWRRNSIISFRPLV